MNPLTIFSPGTEAPSPAPPRLVPHDGSARFGEALSTALSESETGEGETSLLEAEPEKTHDVIPDDGSMPGLPSVPGAPALPAVVSSEPGMVAVSPVLDGALLAAGMGSGALPAPSGWGSLIGAPIRQAQTPAPPAGPSSSPSATGSAAATSRVTVPNLAGPIRSPRVPSTVASPAGDGRAPTPGTAASAAPISLEGGPGFKIPAGWRAVDAAPNAVPSPASPVTDPSIGVVPAGRVRAAMEALASTGLFGPAAPHETSETGFLAGAVKIKGQVISFGAPSRDPAPARVDVPDALAPGFRPPGAGLPGASEPATVPHTAPKDTPAPLLPGGAPGQAPAWTAASPAPAATAAAPRLSPLPMEMPGPALALSIARTALEKEKTTQAGRLTDEVAPKTRPIEVPTPPAPSLDVLPAPSTAAPRAEAPRSEAASTPAPDDAVPLARRPGTESAPRPSERDAGPSRAEVSAASRTPAAAEASPEGRSFFERVLGRVKEAFASGAGESRASSATAQAGPTPHRNALRARVEAPAAGENAAPAFEGVRDLAGVSLRTLAYRPGGLSRTDGVQTPREAVSLPLPGESAVTRPAGSLLVPFTDGAGVEGRIRLFVRGDTVHATILSPDAETVRQLGDRAAELQRALTGRGFAEAQVHVRQTASAPDGKAETGDGRHRERGEDRSREGEERREGRTPDRRQQPSRESPNQEGW